MHQAHTDKSQHAMASMQYRHLAVMVVLSFLSMYTLMYAMVDRFANVYGNVNQFYMAALMTAPMIIIELVVMGAMYANKRLNIIIIAASAFVLVAAFALIRYQGLVYDTQFLRSMIPHHASAVLMCKEATISDAEIRKLCDSILQGQQAEIDQMKAILARQ